MTPCSALLFQRYSGYTIWLPFEDWNELIFTVVLCNFASRATCTRFLRSLLQYHGALLPAITQRIQLGNEFQSEWTWYVDINIYRSVHTCFSLADFSSCCRREQTGDCKHVLSLDSLKLTSFSCYYNFSIIPNDVFKHHFC